MRILIAALHPPGGRLKIGGVQSWSATVGDELLRRGHRLTFWGPANHPLKGAYDVGIIANINHTRACLPNCEKHLVVSHGIIEAEKPEGEHVAFTSEEVRDHWSGNGPIIRQPLDLNFWHPGNEKRKYLTRFSYRGGLPFIETIAERMGLTYIHVQSESQETARGILQQSACVIATGRGAVEAMAMGVPVVLADDRGYQPPLMHTGSVTKWMATNYSARGGITPTESNVSEEIEKAIDRGSLMAHVKAHHDVKLIVDQLLA